VRNKYIRNPRTGCIHRFDRLIPRRPYSPPFPGKVPITKCQVIVYDGEWMDDPGPNDGFRKHCLNCWNMTALREVQEEAAKFEKRARALKIPVLFTVACEELGEGAKSYGIDVTEAEVGKTPMRKKRQCRNCARWLCVRVTSDKAPEGFGLCGIVTHELFVPGSKDGKIYFGPNFGCLRWEKK